MTAERAATLTSDAIKQHGFTAVLATVLTCVVLGFTYQLWNSFMTQSKSWQEVQAADINQLRAEVQTERTFIRESLVQTIEKNSSALESLTDELRTQRK